LKWLELQTLERQETLVLEVWRTSYAKRHDQDPRLFASWNAMGATQTGEEGAERVSRPRCAEKSVLVRPKAKSGALQAGRRMLLTWDTREILEKGIRQKDR